RSRMPQLSPPRKSKLSKPTKPPRYVVGIVLGTTNSGAAYAEIRPNADPFRAGQRRAPAHSATHQPGRSARRGPAAVVPLSPGLERLPGSQPPPPLGRIARLRSGPPGPKARRRERGPAGVLGQELALALGGGPHLAPASVPRAGRRREDFAGGGQPP